MADASDVTTEAEQAAAHRAAMVAKIDLILSAAWEREGITPAEAADDAEFLRRVSLDLNGVIPTPAEVRAFLADENPAKRAHLIDSLAASPSYAVHMANTWRNILVQEDVPFEELPGLAALSNWLRGQFAQNRRYDHLVADLLVTNGRASGNQPTFFYTSRRIQPDELAAATSQVLLGVQIQCAQCHNHPFDHWTQQDFWGYAAFFARVRTSGRPQTGVELVDALDGEVMFPETETVVAPKFLEGESPPESYDKNRRRQLAIWLVSRDNPYLARAAVNRVWAQMFGRGLVEPVDDLGPHNPPSHPELFDELCKYFIATGFDLRELFCTLAQTRAYQLASHTPAGAELPADSTFARMKVKPLSADQLYDSLNRATLQRLDVREQGDMSPLAALEDDPKQAFLQRFTAPGHSDAGDRFGIPQALTLMNGGLVSATTEAAADGILASLDAPFLSDDDRVDILFLATLSRLPTAEERKPLASSIAEAGPDGRLAAMGDLLWALVNSGEFLVNH